MKVFGTEVREPVGAVIMPICRFSKDWWLAKHRGFDPTPAIGDLANAGFVVRLPAIEGESADADAILPGHVFVRADDRKDAQLLGGYGLDPLRNERGRPTVVPSGLVELFLSPASEEGTALRNRLKAMAWEYRVESLLIEARRFRS